MLQQHVYCRKHEEEAADSDLAASLQVQYLFIDYTQWQILNLYVWPVEIIDTSVSFTQHYQTKLYKNLYCRG